MTILYEGREIGTVQKVGKLWHLHMKGRFHSVHKTRKSAVWLANFIDAGDMCPALFTLASVEQANA